MNSLLLNSEVAEGLPVEEVGAVLVAGIVEDSDENAGLEIGDGVEVDVPAFELVLPSVTGGSGGQTIVTVVVVEKLSCFELCAVIEDVTLEDTVALETVVGAFSPAGDGVEEVDSVFGVQVKQSGVVKLSGIFSWDVTEVAVVVSFLKTRGSSALCTIPSI